MKLFNRVRNILRRLVQSHGTESVKRRLWNDEYSSGRWKCLERTGEENAHFLLEKYAQNGAILDLGCGPGTTGIELNPATYTHYTGVDISDVAIEKARSRAHGIGRADRNQYFQSDILSFTPSRHYDVILYGDSIYYIARGQIAPMLKRYSSFLTNSGVIVARLFDISGKHHQILEIIQEHFETVELTMSEQTRACFIVFRPRRTAEFSTSAGT